MAAPLKAKGFGLAGHARERSRVCGLAVAGRQGRVWRVENRQSLGWGMRGDRSREARVGSGAHQSHGRGVWSVGAPAAG